MDFYLACTHVLVRTMDADYFDLGKYKRVLRLASNPDKQEFRRVALITGGGAALVGILGTIIFILMNIGAIL